MRAPETDRLTAPLAWEVLLRSGVMHLLLAVLAAADCARSREMFLQKRSPLGEELIPSGGR